MYPIDPTCYFPDARLKQVKPSFYSTVAAGMVKEEVGKGHRAHCVVAGVSEILGADSEYPGMRVAQTFLKSFDDFTRLFPPSVRRQPFPPS